MVHQPASWLSARSGRMEKRNMSGPSDDKSKSFQIINSILNAVDAFICVTDPETCEILYLNDRLVEHYGLKEGYAGRICYELLRGQSERCPECPYLQLEKDSTRPVVWEQHEPLVNRTFRKVGLYMDWPDGRKAHIEYGFDITDIHQTQAELERRIAMSDALNQSLEIFCAQKEDTFDEVVAAGIAPIARILDIDRVIIYRYTENDGRGWPEQRFRWDNGVINREKVEDIWQGRTEIYSEWLKTLRANECVNQRYGDMSPVTADFVREYGIKSIFIVPVFLQGRFWGCVNFQDHARERLFESQAAELLRAVGNICGSAISRAQAENKAAAANEFNRMLFLTAPIGFLLYDANFKALDCNEHLAALVGLTKTE